MRNERAENIIRLELCAQRYTTELDTWIRKFEDTDTKIYRKLVADIRYPLHELVGKLQSISKEYRKSIEQEVET